MCLKLSEKKINKDWFLILKKTFKFIEVFWCKFSKIYLHYLRRRCENRTPFADHAPFANYFLHETISTPSFCKWCKRELRWITRISLSLFLFQTHFFHEKNIFPKTHNCLLKVCSCRYQKQSQSKFNFKFSFKVLLFFDL